MKLERYLIRKNANLDYFGDHFIEKSWNIIWYFADQDIGILPNFSNEAENFVEGLLVRRDETLIITPSEISPKIQRKINSFGVIFGDSSGGVELISPLVELLQQDTVHLFYASAREDGNPRHKILAFSANAPNPNIYDKGTSMRIRIRDEINYETQINNIEKIKKNISANLIKY